MQLVEQLYSDVCAVNTSVGHFEVEYKYYTGNEYVHISAQGFIVTIV